MAARAQTGYLCGKHPWLLHPGSRLVDDVRGTHLEQQDEVVCGGQNVLGIPGDVHMGDGAPQAGNGGAGPGEVVGVKQAQAAIRRPHHQAAVPCMPGSSQVLAGVPGVEVRVTVLRVVSGGGACKGLGFRVEGL